MGLSAKLIMRRFGLPGTMEAIRYSALMSDSKIMMPPGITRIMVRGIQISIKQSAGQLWQTLLHRQLR